MSLSSFLKFVKRRLITILCFTTGQHTFKEVANKFKFVKEDETPLMDRNQKAEPNPEVSESRKLSNTSSVSTSSPYSSPHKKTKETHSDTTEVSMSGGGAKEGTALQGLSDMEETLEIQRMMKEAGESSTGKLIRSVLRQTDPQKLEYREEDDESYTFKPAGVMAHAKANIKTTTRRQKEVDELELEMAQYVMERQNRENSQQEEYDYDDWGGTRNKPLVMSQENINRDSILNQYLAMTAKENACREAEYHHQQDTVSTHTNSGSSTTLQSFSSVRSPTSPANEAVGSFNCPQQTVHHSEFKYGNSVSDDNQSAQGSDTLTQGSIGSSIPMSTRSGQLPQQRCLYRGQISSKPLTSQIQNKALNLNTSLPTTFETPKSNQRGNSVSVPATPSVTEETSENCLNKAKHVGSGAPPTIANLSKFVSLLSKNSVRSTPASDQKPSKDLNDSSGAFAPSRRTSSIQESTVMNPQTINALKSSRFTTCVQKPFSNNNIAQVSSPLGKEITQNSSGRSGSVTEALSSTNSKLQRLKILAGALKNSEK